MASIDTQNKVLLGALHNGPITARDALNRFGIARAAARVWDLRQEGWEIASRRITVPSRSGEPRQVAQYALTSRRRRRAATPRQAQGRARA